MVTCCSIAAGLACLPRDRVHHKLEACYTVHTHYSHRRHLTSYISDKALLQDIYAPLESVHPDAPYTMQRPTSHEERLLSMTIACQLSVAVTQPRTHLRPQSLQSFASTHMARRNWRSMPGGGCEARSMAPLAKHVLAVSSAVQDACVPVSPEATGRA